MSVFIPEQVSSWGSVDGKFVNDTGIIRDKMIVSMSEDDFDPVVPIHLQGTQDSTEFATGPGVDALVLHEHDPGLERRR